MKTYYVTHNNQQYGPFDEPTLRKHVAAGTYQRTDTCWCSGMEEWLPIEQVLQLPQIQRKTSNHIVTKLLGKTKIEIVARLLVLAALILLLTIEIKKQQEAARIRAEAKPQPISDGVNHFSEYYQQLREEYPHLGHPDISQYRDY